MTKVLIFDQSKSMRNSLSERLKDEGFAPTCADRADLTANGYQGEPFDVIISDEEYDSLPATLREIPLVVVSSQTSIELALKAAKSGALDYLSKPVDMNRLLRVLRDVSDGEASVQQVTPKVVGRRGVCSGVSVEAMIGYSEQMTHLRELIDKVAPSDARVLIMGENGTGKELVARWLHCKSQRSRQPFVEINCAAIPSELIESELFGHEKGAFTSAVKQRKGKFEQANGGTIFMDEIGDMSLSAQAKVLRVLQERKISRVGSDKDIDVDVRVIVATNTNIREEIAKGNFREDLYHRIGVIVLKVQPLRERASDIPLLVDYFLDKICEEYHLPRKSISSHAVDLLSRMEWTGNIRELRNVVERMVILSGDEITISDVEVYC